MIVETLQEIFVFVLGGSLIVWMAWTAAEIFEFQRQSERQAAISKPQVVDKARKLVKGTLVTWFPLELVSFLLFAVAGESRPDLTQFASLLLLSLIMPIFYVVSMLLGIVRFYKKGLPVTELREVPIPEQHPPPPWADKSFDQLIRH